MEKAPIKRNENIVKLSKDHHASLLFCWKLRQGIRHEADAERMIKYVNYFWGHHFSDHFQEEERILFAPLKDELVKKAIEDHRLVKALIDELNTPGTEEVVSKLSRLADVVDAHVRFEERKLFPHLERELSVEQLEDIGKRLPTDAIKDNFEDTFWIKKTS